MSRPGLRIRLAHAESTTVLHTGTSIEGRLRSGEAALDGFLSNARLDCFNNVMIYGAPAFSDASPQFTHGWPRSLIKGRHGGFRAENITCCAGITNLRIRSMSRGDVAAFVSSEEVSGGGLALSELLYCRKAALLCDRERHTLPARLVDASVRYGVNFATMQPLEQDQLQRLVISA